MALNKHNCYGLSPTIGSAHCLLVSVKTETGSFNA